MFFFKQNKIHVFNSLFFSFFISTENFISYGSDIFEDFNRKVHQIKNPKIIGLFLSDSYYNIYFKSEAIKR